MKFWTVGMECAGLAEAGGVKNVTYSIAAKMAQLGNDVTLFIPVFGCSSFDAVTDLRDAPSPLSISLCGKNESVRYSFGRFKDKPVQIVFMRHPSFSEKQAVYVYTQTEQDANPSNVRGCGHRDMLFLDALFSKAVASYAETLPDAELPDIVHCHDAATAILPTYFMQSARRKLLQIQCAVTIHNAGPAYHHEFKDVGEAEYYTGLPAEKLRQAENWGRIEPFLLAGLDAALTTVSTFYAAELKNPANDGITDGLAPLFAARKIEITGITNGIDPARYLPEEPELSGLPFAFSPEQKLLDGKIANRKFLTNMLTLPDDGTLDGVKRFGTMYGDGRDAIWFAYHGRIAAQKGIDLLIQTAGALMQNDPDIRFVIMGQGERYLEQALEKWTAQFSGRAVYFKGYNRQIARLVIAAADFAVMPSRFEPCGLEDFIAQLYGTLPIAHATGGLKKIIDGKTGFLYAPNTPSRLAEVLTRAAAFKRSRFPAFEQMIADAAASVKKHYAWDAIVKNKYLPFFMKLLSRSET